MNCEKYLVLIDDLIEERLDEPTSQDIFSHFIDCRNCEAEFESRFNEKELCATFIKNIEPLTNLPEQFQANLKVLRERESARAGFSFKERLENLLTFLSPKFGLAALLLLIIFGLIHLGLTSSTNPAPASVAQPVITNPIVAAISDAAPDLNKNAGIREIAKNTGEPARISIIKTPIRQRKPMQIADNPAVVIKTTAQKDGSQKIVEVSKRDDESESRLMKIESFMAETRKQMEKTEMLLRSFRNARIVEGSDKFDIYYESQQAKELLERNAALRKIAEDYGNDDVEKTLYATEMILNEIVNLEGDFSQARVIAIKKQINSRNIIAILQTYQTRSANS
jgi:hypothetical protein